MGKIVLPNEIVTSDKTPRTAIAFDKTSGVKQTVDTTREVLLVGMMATTGATVAASVPTALLREDDAATYFGAGSMLDIACRAAFKANPFVLLHGVGVADAGTKATATVTFATTATGNTSFQMRIAGRAIEFDIATADTATVIGDALVTAINAAHAIDPLPVSAVNAVGVVTLTARNGGVIGNTIQLRLGGPTGTGFGASVTTTAVLSAQAMGAPVAGVGSAVVTAALAASTGKRYHVIADLIGDATSGAAMKTHTDTESGAEFNHGCIFVQAVNGTQSAATTQATTLNANRGMIAAVNTSETWPVVTCAAFAAAESSEEIATRPRNGMVLNGVMAPPVEKRWTRTETRTMISNGVTPLTVLPGEQVAVMRACSMGVKTAGTYDYSTLDITKFLAFDHFRDAIVLMFETNYQKARWADSDPDGLLPPDVATPEKVRIDLIDVARDMERDGIVQNVSALEDQFVVEKVGTSCRFSVPAAIVDGMHEKLGKIVYVNRPLA